MKKLTRDCGFLVVMASVVLIMLVGVFSPVFAQAKNSSDTRLTRYAQSYDSVFITRSRRKEDVSPMYTFNDKSASAYKAKGVGRYNGSQGEDDYNCSESTVIDFKFCSRGYAYKIRTNVYELGFNYGSLKVYPQFATGWVNMLWSPDSLS
ncbi:MAG: hypothetical protein E7001_06735 [Coriobacteriaceae bacterium]|nr:hypothetical protein [Coriobacteriaceae bacterium]